MQAIAFYLPQFYPIPENEKVYGKNFTEWDNTRGARALFDGHYQPRIPHRTLGYYNLTDDRFLTFQHELAFENGITGFCYYYYNFSGKRLLEKPVDLVNHNRIIKNRFCLCWDHQDWCYNRDNVKKPFITQTYSRENAKRIIGDLLQYFDNERYITVDDKPMFCIFAPERNPAMLQYAEIWREEAIKHGLPGLWLAGVEAYAGAPPEWFGLDSMIEYAPDWHTDALLSDPSNPLRVFDYPTTLRFMLQKENPGYIRNRCVFPGWDNTPRRGGEGALAINATPKLYKLYLDAMCEHTVNHLPDNLQYIFINAWNEWGESCYLEPDEKYGFTYIKITRDILNKYNQNS